VRAAAVWAAWVRAERSHSEPLVVEHVVERLPIHARWFHPDQFDLEGGQPVPKLQQSPWVVVLNLRISWWGSSSLFLAVAILTHAVKEALCGTTP
jgi:hypothetical protein